MTVIKYTRYLELDFDCCVLSVPQDAHNCIPEFDEETAMFAVYDGHGGNAQIP